MTGQPQVVSTPSDLSSPPRELVSWLTSHGQGHLLRFWAEIPEAGRVRLLNQIQLINLDLVDDLRAGRGVAHPPDEGLLEAAELPQVIPFGKGTGEFSPSRAKEAGLESLRAGEVGVLLVAGGKGTRLGFSYPKGLFPIGPVSGVSLFQIHAEKVLARSHRLGVQIPFCIMTSLATEVSTRAYFAACRYFGLPRSQVRFFVQGVMPAVDAETGQILLAAKDRIALSPDGHGGMLAALAKSGLLEELKSAGIKRLFYFQVDNPLVDICCPEFLGYHLLSRAEVTTQVVLKKTPQDRVGNVVRVKDRLTVVEYSDLPPHLAERKGPDGGLLFRWGSIAVHIFELSFLEKALRLAEALPWHLARKKVPYVNLEGQLVQPKSPNAVQFERFIFDLLPYADRAILVAVPEETHFAPLKNASGDPGGDTPETVQAALCRLWREWLRQAGIVVSDDVPVEISPLFAVEPAELVGKLRAGTSVEEPTYLREAT
ncbi:MAG: UDPGP type 1 family protein [Thermoguttaceae bacterium]|nr:UDPGP type 1 family protein [Thermoguttaceae bacterium]MDW8079460.1 UDPGP type 1 family protein [Thermoguttaceae bacterium]